MKFYKNIYGSRIRISDLDMLWEKDQIRAVPADKVENSLDISKGYVEEVADIVGNPFGSYGAAPSNGVISADKQPDSEKEENQWVKIYDNLNVAEIESLVGSIENVEVVRQILEFEEGNKNRKSALSAINSRIETLTSQK